jgi:hypothetical protein
MRKDDVVSRAPARSEGGSELMTTAEAQEIAAIRAVVADADTLQSDAEGFAQLLTEDVAVAYAVR